MNVTPELLTLSYGPARVGVNFDRWAACLTLVVQPYQLTTPQRLAAFLAQVGQESGCLQYTRELWGPTAQQLKYEPGYEVATQTYVPLATRLGNTNAGDGYRFRGAGLIQTTGLDNFKQVVAQLRRRFPDLGVPDFTLFPEMLCVHRWAALSAGEFWDSRNLNALADIGDTEAITLKVNGGRTHLAEREAFYRAALPACVLLWSDL